MQNYISKYKALILSCSAHWYIDAISSMIIFTAYKPLLPNNPNTVFQIILIYNFLAFAFQPLAGIISDRFKLPKIFIVLAIILSLFVLVFNNKLIFLSVVIIGLANALTHIGTGTVILTKYRNKATYAGILVAPGALGLLLGAKFFESSTFVYFLIVSGVLLIFLFHKYLNIEFINDLQSKVLQNQCKNKWLIIGLLGVIIMIRSFVGLSIGFPWKSDQALLVLLVIATFFGKALGGYFADRYGFNKIGVMSLLISAPLLAFASKMPLLALPGIFLFQMTMPITLTLIASLLPKRIGLAFGLTTLFLFIGFTPVILRLAPQVTQIQYLYFLLILISAPILALSIKLYKKNAPLIPIKNL